MDSNNNVVSNSSNVNDMLQSDPIPPSNLLASREKSNFPEIPKLKLSKPSSPNKRYYSLLKDKRNAVQAKRNSQPDSSVLLGSPDEKKSLAAQSPNSKPYKHKSLSISSVQKDEVIAHDLSELDLQNMHTYNVLPKNGKLNENENNNPSPNSGKYHKSVWSSPKKPSFTYPKATMLHYNKLKQKIGMNTHIAHPRQYRDIPCSSKDIDLAIDATRVIELNRERVKRLAESLRPTSTMGKRMNTKEGESFILNFDNDKFLINNPIFSTLWERIFIRKDMILTSGKQNFMNHDEKDEERLLSKYSFKNGLPYFKGNVEEQEKLRSSTISNGNNPSLVKFLDRTNNKSVDIENAGPKILVETHLSEAKKTNPLNKKRFFDSKGNTMAQTQAETATLFTMKKNKMSNTADPNTILQSTDRELYAVKTLDESKFQYDSLLKRTMVKRINYIARQKGAQGGYAENPLEFLSQTYIL